MAKLINIYTLENTENGHIFYVGATVQRPELRLSAHLSDARNRNLLGKTISDSRHTYVKGLLLRGIVIKITVVKRAYVKNADFWESHYYNLYKNEGHAMLQDERRFYYSSGRSKMIGRKLRDLSKC